MSRTRFWTISAVLLALVTACGLWFQAHCRIVVDPQVTPSLDNRLFLIDIDDRTPVTGAVFAFRTRGTAPVFPDGTQFAKVMAGVPGDTVEITADFAVLVNGTEVARGMPFFNGQDVEMIRRKFVGKKKLAADEYWMMGTNPKSFDSRYWGVMHEDQIIGRAYPFF